MRLLFIIFIFIPVFTPAQNLQVSENGRYLTRDGKPFVWIGDTAWELFHKLNREEATEYLHNRRDKKFNIIQAVILAELDGLRKPNPYGAVPLHNLDPTQPNEKYFNHVDFIVKTATDLGMVMGLLPTWGDKLKTNNPGGGPVVFTPENAAVFGEFLGRRYRDYPVVWILGGDRNIDSENNYLIWEAIARGIHKGDQGKHLITYHPRGTSTSSYWLHDEPWLDFNMYQSGHVEHFHKVYEFAEREYLLQPAKPFIDGEPPYEDIALKFWEHMDFSKYSNQRVPKGVLDESGIIKKTAHFVDGFFDDYDVRIHAYWNFLAGACGYTYGNNAVWQMFKKGGEVAIPALTDWRSALNRPGAEDMSHVRALFESRPLSKMVPDQSIIYGVNPKNQSHIRAAKADDGSFLMVYLAQGQPASIRMNNIANKNVTAWWFNPREGTAEKIGEYIANGIQRFTPPSSGHGNDWLLVIDDKKFQYPIPGKWQ